MLHYVLHQRGMFHDMSMCSILRVCTAMCSNVYCINIHLAFSAMFHELSICSIIHFMFCIVSLYLLHQHGMFHSAPCRCPVILYLRKTIWGMNRSIPRMNY